MQMTVFDPKLPLREETRSQPDQYVAIISEGGATGELDTSPWDRQIVSEGKKVIGENRDLCFVPYYLRANRGGRGQMRVGLRVE
jgi:hypothetical protein